MKIGKILIILMFIGTMFFLSSCEETTEPEESATLIVNSTPPGATIILDGDQTRAVTPATLEIEPGYHELRLELTGYQDYFETFTVEDGDTYNVDATLIEAYDTTLQMISVPAGATIYIDGTYTGLITPATIDGLVP